LNDKTNGSPIRCRFAPSPTGYLHVGGARTALFNYLFARANNGKYILRIEDTDRERSTEEAVKAIFDGLDWLKLLPDEKPCFQSERNELYLDCARRLLANGFAYPCWCTQEELDRMRDAQREAGQTPRYNGTHRPKEAQPQPTELPKPGDERPFVIRLRTPQSGTLSFDDLILGEITTPLEEIDDFIIIRSDGTPTYNFVVVVDDADMDITHVIRGMDHVSNTPKQILIYEALQADLPAFAHVPMILGADKKKLSKRHGATSVIEYQKDGYLSDAFVNYLARLGWSYGDQEVFTRQELESLFRIENIGKSPAVFDTEKLLWVNAEHIKAAPAESLVRELTPFLEEHGFQISGIGDNKAFLKLMDSLRPRARTLGELAKAMSWFFAKDEALPIDADAAAKHLRPEIKAPLLKLTEQLQEAEPFDELHLEPIFQGLVEEYNIKLGKLAQPVRVALTGSSVSPPIYTVLEILGKECSLRRLRSGIALIRD